MAHKKELHEKKDEAKKARRKAMKKHGKVKQKRIVRDNPTPPKAQKHETKEKQRGDGKAVGK